MKKIMGAAMLAGATIAGVGAANAEVSATVTLTTDYVFRGLSQSDGGPAVQGSFDWSNDSFYAGAWASSVNFGAVGPNELASMELDLYAGFTPSTGAIDWDLGVVGYFYPNADDSLAAGELDYYEGIVGASFNVTEAWALGAQVAYSPEFFGETGDALYWELNTTFNLSEATALTAAFGEQDVDIAPDSYTNWSLGVTHAMHGFTVGLQYTDTEDAFDNGYVLDETNADGRFILSLGRSL